MAQARDRCATRVDAALASEAAFASAAALAASAALAAASLRFSRSFFSPFQYGASSANTASSATLRTKCLSEAFMAQLAGGTNTPAAVYLHLSS